MNPRDHRARLRRATGEAQARRNRARVEIERREDRSPRPGDVLGFTETVEQAVLWAVLEGDSGRGFLLVAADLHPLAGSSDVAVPAESACGALCLRCGFEVRLTAEAVETAKCVSVLEPEDLDRARHKRAQIEIGSITGSALERDTDGDPEYQDWLEDGPAKAQAALLKRFNARQVFANGVDAVTGGYLMSPVQPSQAAAWVRREKIDLGVLSLLRHVHRVSSQPHLGLPAGVDPIDLGQAGWGVVYQAAESQAVKDALQPLVEHRQARIGAAKTRLLDYRPGEESRQWLSRHGVAAGRIQPGKVPYYLLLVGSPVIIPYEFQQLLGVEYAVGRLSLETAADYRRYAESIVDHETRRHAAQSQTAVFFGPRHAFDPTTQWSADQLVKPLMDGLPAATGESGGFTARKLWGETATKANLREVFHPTSGTEPAALLFAAAHGLGWPWKHPRQMASQGALLCQDWPALGRISPENHCFGAADLKDDARVLGTIIFLHAAFSAGTPERSGVKPESAESPPEIAREPFVASLTQRLLAHPQGGAAAVIGFVDRAWALPATPVPVQDRTSPVATARVQSFHDALEGMLGGWPVGHAVKELKKRYAELATRLETLRQKMAMGARLDEGEVAALWSERNNARSLVVVGDPAVRVRGT